jgi:2-phospho-L-lactate guanylyltransferase (CobY/MobA/RfbA family)
VPVVVIPFRAGGKTRLPEELRAELSLAMLGDVLDAAVSVGHVLLVTDDLAARGAAAASGVAVVDDPGRGQGAAVAAALEHVDGHALVVNADLPCVTREALLTLAAAGDALAEAADGTTNALSLTVPTVFRDLYGYGSARRFAAAGSTRIVIPELAADVDTLGDLLALELPLGLRTAVVSDRLRAQGSMVGSR